MVRDTTLRVFPTKFLRTIPHSARDKNNSSQFPRHHSQLKQQTGGAVLHSRFSFASLIACLLAIVSLSLSGCGSILPHSVAGAIAAPSNPSSAASASAATLQYHAPLFSSTSMNTSTAMNGQVSIDTAGNATVQLTGATADTSFTVQFCPAFDASTKFSAPACFPVTSLSTDAGGNATSTVKFPQPGNWAGDFQVMAGGKEQYITSLAPGVNGETFLATLEPESTTNRGVMTLATPQSPLTGGAVTYANGTVTFTMTGASASSLFTTTESETRYVGSSGTYKLNTFTTDAQGVANSNTQLSGTGGDMLEALPQNGAGFIGGFSVPQ